VGNMVWCHPSEIEAVVSDAALDNMATRCLLGAWTDTTGQPLLVMNAVAILNLFA
jgi:hypothetical protein